MKRWHWYALGLFVGCIAFAVFLARQETNAVAAPDEAGKAAGGIARCGTPEITDERTLAAIRQQIAARQKAGPIPMVDPLVIPVQFIHITNGSQGQITDQQRADQLEVLNDAYGSYGIEFVSNGPPKVQNNATWFTMQPDSDAETAAKTALHEDPNTILNFYTCGPGGGLLGWATFPWWLAGDPELDGVVCHWQSLPGGTLEPYNLGHTATHEVGHWVGLYHTFQGGCSGSGDQVDDTVAHASPNFGCPSPGQNGACNANQQAPIHNFMNYTDDDCMTEFTDGQATRWQTMIATYRPDLGGSPPCDCPLDCLRVSVPQLLPEGLLPQLRVMRDNLLEKSPDGRRLARLYYRHSSELFGILVQDPELAQRSIHAILTALPKDLGASGQVVMSAELYDECLVLMERLQTQAGPGLTDALEDVRAILDRRATVAGKMVVLRFPAEQRQVARVTSSVGK